MAPEKKEITVSYIMLEPISHIIILRQGVIVYVIITVSLLNMKYDTLVHNNMST